MKFQKWKFASLTACLLAGAPVASCHKVPLPDTATSSRHLTQLAVGTGANASIHSGQTITSKGLS